MAIKIMPLPAAQADEFIAPYDGILSAVFVDSDGNPIDITGGVKKGAAVDAMGVADPAAAAAAPTKAEYDALLAYAKGLKVTLNALIASLKASGAIG
ncbi:hypothetical protein [Bifidobacterium jacchi]|uniref:Head fiber protein n=1 Tax=Bifidobacterium jacchi TaxID=2490545 RepID=A0A5N5RM85_9BIFI|nr:hypothetical protein [Bifidobacterium jacchi]KAB5608407.1 hypothetical protein EHS19_01940 [Bifidobacterium jacchi]